MKKSRLKFFVYLVLLVILILVFGAVLMGTGDSDEGHIKYSKTVRVIDGTVAEPESFTAFSVDTAGNYILKFSLLPEGVSKEDVGSVGTDDLGFITTILVTDSKGAVRYSSVQTAVYLDTKIYLEEGDYNAGFIVYTDRDEFFEYASENFLSRKEAETIANDTLFDSFPENSEQVMEYEFAYEPDAVISGNNAMIIGLVLVLSLVLVLVCREALIMHGGDVRDKYDERQIFEQGKGFKLGFFTLLIEIGIMICFDSMGLVPSFAFYGGALFIGIIVYAVYCIWHESYFAVNRTGKDKFIMFAVIFLMNLIICIINYLSGTIIQNGVPTIRILNVYCVVAFLIIFAAIFIKRYFNRKSESSEDEEE
jgi:hypothetical protein